MVHIVLKDMVSNAKHVKVILNLFRGDEFRAAFAHLGELRSVLLNSVKVIALMATGTPKAVQAMLAMDSPVAFGFTFTLRFRKTFLKRRFKCSLRRSVGTLHPI